LPAAGRLLDYLESFDRQLGDQVPEAPLAVTTMEAVPASPARPFEINA
jgi:hypothetical protein